MNLQHKIFEVISQSADALGVKAFVVGGYVRDLILKKDSKDIDFVTVGSGIELAKKVAANLNVKKVVSYQRFGTAMFRYLDWELEFVGARKESYDHLSRKPIVENGTLEDDQNRRDFTINTMAIQLSGDKIGNLLDPFKGQEDIKKKIIRTPLSPEQTFSDDPLRMMRAIRFASQLDFIVEPETYKGIVTCASRLKIVSMERILIEFNKILLSPKPSKGLILLEESGLLQFFLPELCRLKGVETRNGIRHKDNFYHTLKVVDNLREKSDDLWLLWAALLHDIAKPLTKKFHPKTGWTFHAHDFIGARLVPKLFQRLKLPQNEKMRTVSKMVELHMRPIALAEDEVTDSAVRRLLFDAGEDIDQLMLLCEADITSKSEERKKRYLKNFALVRKKLTEVEEKDAIRNFHVPVRGEEIMELFGLGPCREIGTIKEAVKEAILNGIIGNNHEEARSYAVRVAEELGLKPKR